MTTARYRLDSARLVLYAIRAVLIAITDTNLRWDEVHASIDNNADTVADVAKTMSTLFDNTRAAADKNSGVERHIMDTASRTAYDAIRALSGARRVTAALRANADNNHPYRPTDSAYFDVYNARSAVVDSVIAMISAVNAAEAVVAASPKQAG